MTREEAYEFVRLYKKAVKTGVKIVDFDDTRVELQFEDGDKAWRSDWVAAKIFEANYPYEP